MLKHYIYLDEKFNNFMTFHKPDYKYTYEADDILAHDKFPSL